MQRRSFLKLTGLASVTALGVGYWALPSGPAPAALSIAAAQALLLQLSQQPLVSHAGWSPAEVFNHCAQSIDFSMDGYPQLKPAWFRSSVGPAAFAVFAARGAMRHPLTEAIPGAPAITEPADPALALQRLQAAFARFASYNGALQAHFAYGALSHAEYAQAHVLHLYNHLSRLGTAA